MRDLSISDWTAYDTHVDCEGNTAWETYSKYSVTVPDLL